MRKILSIMFIVIVVVVAYNLMNGAFEFSAIVNHSYDNLHEAAKLASLN